jgi:hypothetical protein
MTQKSPTSDFTPERCQHRTPTGRQCRSLVADPSGSFCAAHAASEPADSEDFTAAVTEKACRFQNADGINYSLGVLYTLLAQGRISPRRASVLAYISNLLLRTLPAIDNDRFPYAGRPGFNAKGERIPQNEVDPADDAPSSEDTAKSQKPN